MNTWIVAIDCDGDDNPDWPQTIARTFSNADEAETFIEEMGAQVIVDMGYAHLARRISFRIADLRELVADANDLRDLVETLNSIDVQARMALH